MQKSYRLLFSVSRLYLRETQASIYKADAAQYKQKTAFQQKLWKTPLKAVPMQLFLP